MKFNLDENLDSHAVSAYAEGWIRVGERRIDSPCVIAPDRVLIDVLPPAVIDLEVRHFEPIRELAPEIVLLGTGARQIFVDHAITVALADHGIALETMDTGAACRSFNILLAESRPVVAVLFML